jgi:hypothetical protein
MMIDEPVLASIVVDGKPCSLQGRLGVSFLTQRGQMKLDRVEFSGCFEDPVQGFTGSLVMLLDAPDARITQSPEGSRRTMRVVTAGTGTFWLSLSVPRSPAHRLTAPQATQTSQLVRVNLDIRVPIGALREPSTRVMSCGATLRFSLTTVAGSQRVLPMTGSADTDGHSVPDALKRIAFAQARAVSLVLDRGVRLLYAVSALARVVRLLPHFVDVASGERVPDDAKASYFENGLERAREVWGKVGILVEAEVGEDVYVDATEAHIEFGRNAARWKATMDEVARGTAREKITHVWYFLTFEKEGARGVTLAPGVAAASGAAGDESAYIVTGLKDAANSEMLSVNPYIVAHELGHVLGLRHPIVPRQVDPAACGTPTAQPGTPRTVLCTSDAGNDEQMKNSAWNYRWALHNTRFRLVPQLTYAPDWCDGGQDTRANLCRVEPNRLSDRERARLCPGALAEKDAPEGCT